jgi:endonuclease/exonuclease/phosphatase family metal-dependent hydrolase
VDEGSMTIFRSILILTSLLVLIWGCTGADQRSTEERTTTLTVKQSEPREGRSAPSPSPTLRAVTLNLAHGRKDSLNQLLVSEEQIRENLDDIATFLKDSKADVVALQEADGPSGWSGDFDHVAYLAEAAGFRYHVRAEHAQIRMANYGTAVLSRWPIKEAMGLTFADTPPTTSKGFTLAQIEWHNPQFANAPVTVDVISVHLDFSRKSVRLQQIDELANMIEKRASPLIIMGDFNSEWLAEEYLVESTAKTSRLQVYKPASDDLNTYKDKRLDWIMLSRRLEFNDYDIEQRLLSDHKAVTAEILWREREAAQ